MKYLLFFLSLISLLSINGADLTVVRTDTPPKIDGKLDDRAHFAATAAKSLCGGFFSRAYTQLADYQPLVLLSYDDAHLYVGFYGPTAPVQEPSKAFNWYDDLFQIIIGERSFAVTASGACDPVSVRGAALLQADRWTAELAIPWSVTGYAPPKKGTKLPFRILTYQTKTRDWQIYLPLVQSPRLPGYMAFGETFPVAYRPRSADEDQF